MTFSFDHYLGGFFIFGLRHEGLSENDVCPCVVDLSPRHQVFHNR